MVKDENWSSVGRCTGLRHSVSRRDYLSVGYEFLCLALLKTKILRIKALRRRTSPNANRVGKEINLLQTWWYIIVDVGGQWVDETEISEKEWLLDVMYHLVWMPRGVPSPNLALTFVPMEHRIVPGM